MKSIRLCMEGQKVTVQRKSPGLELGRLVGSRRGREWKSREGLEEGWGESSKGSDPVHLHLCHPGAMQGEGPD